jgi:hypothetical protein
VCAHVCCAHTAGVFVKTLRNMWAIVAVFNPLFIGTCGVACVVARTHTCAHSAGDVHC